MSNKIEDIDIKNQVYYFFNIISIKNFNPTKIKIDQKSCKNILIYWIGYVPITYSNYVKINSVNSLYLNISKTNGYFEEDKKNEYSTLFPCNKSKEIKEHEELCSKIRDLIRSVTKIQMILKKNILISNLNQIMTYF